MVLREGHDTGIAASPRPASSSTASAPAAPFLRWAGGKRWLVPTIKHLLPESFDRYVEPFLGSGAVFFGIAPPNAWLSDRNHDLVETFWAVRDEPKRVLQILLNKPLTKEQFALEAARVPDSRAARAARFIFLNRTAWNGLYRVNQKGTFNVPFGTPVERLDATEIAVRAASVALQAGRIGWLDFAPAIRRARKRDIVFADPPYTVTHGDNGFRSYNSRIFSWADQERLCRELSSLSSRGGFFILSNADHESVVRLYRKYTIFRIARTSIIAADPTKRRSVTELVITNLRPASPPERCAVVSATF